MLVAIIILAILLAGSAAFIFWLLQVLKNTFSITETLVDLTTGKSAYDKNYVGNRHIAYNGKYYPATVIATVVYESPQECVITDLSQYDEKGLAAFTVMTKQKFSDAYPGYENLSEEAIEELKTPVIMYNMLIYEVEEGEWMWKEA